MTTDEMLACCMKKKGAVLEYPFGSQPACVKVGGRIFAQIYEADGRITLNCNSADGEFYRKQYPGSVLRGYHCPAVVQPYFNTILPDGKVPKQELRSMIDCSYDRVVGKLSKKLRKELGL